MVEPDRRGPAVRGGFLHGTGPEPVAVGSAGWFAWLGGPGVAALRVEDTDPPYGARRERRGTGGFWYAHRRAGGRLRKVYLGRPADLTAERLHAAADELADPVGAVTPRVARPDATAAVRRMLRAHRLVTLAGTGGIGKSSLAAEVAAAGPPPWTVELTALDPAAGPDRVAAAVRAGLGAQEQPGRTAVGTIAAFLAGAPRLLVLDNCEHLAAVAAAVVTELLGACPRVPPQPAPPPGQHPVEPLDPPPAAGLDVHQPGRGQLGAPPGVAARVGGEQVPGPGSEVGPGHRPPPSAGGPGDGVASTAATRRGTSPSPNRWPKSA